MDENKFYIMKETYIDLINKIGGKYLDKKERPVFCCIKDKNIQGLFWAIPTSDIAHRSKEQIDKIKYFCSLPQRDIRSSYYHIGKTNRPSIFKISNALPITDKHIEREYISQGQVLVMKDKSHIEQISKKLSRILLAEERNPNKFEQHITDIRSYLVEELSQTESIQNKIEKAAQKAEAINNAAHAVSKENIHR